MEQNAALTVLRGMSTEYPVDQNRCLPADDGKPAENAPAPSTRSCSQAGAGNTCYSQASSTK